MKIFKECVLIRTHKSLSIWVYKKPLNISCSSFHCHLSKHVVEIKCNWSIMIRKYFTCWELRAWNVALVSKMQPSYLAFQQTTTPSRFEVAITRFASFPTADKSMQNLWASLSSPLVFLITQDKRGAIWSLELVWRMWVCSYCCQNCVPNTWCMGLRILLTCSIVPLQFFHIRSFVSFPSGSIWILSSSDDGGLSKLCELIAKSFLR